MSVRIKMKIHYNSKVKIIQSSATDFSWYEK